MSTQSQNIVATLKRFVRRISAQQGDVATSAFSLAMLVFLVQKAQAASIADTPLDVAPTEKSGLEQVRHTFGNAAQESVGDFDYSAIAEALAKINQRYDDASWLEEQAMADMATGTDSSGDAPSADAELATVESYLQDAVQYAQASQAAAVPESTDAAAAQPANVDGTAPGGAPSVAASAGLAGLSNVLPFLLGGVALAGAGGGGGGGGTSEIVVTPSGIELTEVKGTVVNGYVAKATVFQDLNGNNKWDEGEPKTETGADGSFTLEEQLGSKASIVIYGGTDLSTGLAYSNILKGPPGATAITPLTTLVSALMASGKTQADAEAAVLKAFGLDDGTDLLNFDPVAKADGADTQELAVKIKAAGVLVANLMDSGGSALAGASNGDASAFSYNIAQTIATKISALTTNQPLDLGNTVTLKAILTDSATSAKLSTEQASKFNAISDSAANAVATVNGTIQAAATDSTKSAAEKFNEFSKAQTVAQGTLSDQIKSAADAGNPNTIPDKATIESSVEAVIPINNQPTVASSLSASATEAGTAISVDLLKDAKDLDVGDTAKLSVSDVRYKIGKTDVSKIPAGLTLNGSVLMVDPSNAAFNSLAAGQTQSITVSYKISDGHGGTVDQTATVTIAGKSQSVEISLSEAKSLYEANTYYSADDLVTVAVGGVQNINLNDLRLLGVDLIDIGGGEVSDTLHISVADAAAVNVAELEFAAADTISLDVTAEQLNATGSYLNGNLSLNTALTDATGGLGLSDLRALGVDLIDIGGGEVATLHISANDAKAVAQESLQFAASDHIVLDLGVTTTVAYAGDLSSSVQIATGLSLTQVHTLGIDTIDIAGKNAADAHINVADASAVDAAELDFAAADTISLDVTADQLQATGSHLTGSLDDALSQATDGLGLSGLHDLGVDLIDIGGKNSDVTLHLLESDEQAWTESGLQLGEGDKFIFDLESSVSTGSSAIAAAAKPASIMGDAVNLQAQATDQVEVDRGVLVTVHQDTDFALGADHSLKDLLVALGDSGIVSDEAPHAQDLVASVAVGADADIAINDSMVKALLDDGMLLVDTASTIEVDTDAENMSTSLLQLVDIGADKVVTSKDKVFVDLGAVSDAGQLSNLLSSLLEDSEDTNLSTLFVHQTDGESVQEVGLVLTADQAGLAADIEGNSNLLAQLTHVGITELLVATDDGVKGDVQMLGHEYHKQPIA